ncbi:hypothetical protein B0H14DRAFT_1314558 [Mycena olivaceomarginata]|nr:hypothetical protein B0H14DRAFT_1314558 [Mycena olivaceomarginata]
MPRIPYVYPAAGESEVGDRIRARRGKQGLLPIDGMLLNTPEVARGYSELVGAIRGKTEIADTLRELLALRVLALSEKSRADYIVPQRNTFRCNPILILWIATHSFRIIFNSNPISSCNGFPLCNPIHHCNPL